MAGKVKYTQKGEAVQVWARVWDVEKAKIHGLSFLLGKGEPQRKIESLTIKPGYLMTMWSGVKLTKPPGFSFLVDLAGSLRDGGLCLVSWEVIPKGCEGENEGTIKFTIRNPAKAENPVVIDAGDQLVTFWQVPDSLDLKGIESPIETNMHANAQTMPEAQTMAQTMAEMQVAMKKMRQEIEGMKENIKRLEWK